MAPDTISAHDVSVKILHRFRPEHSCPHHNIFKKRRAVRRLAFGFSGPPCFPSCKKSKIGHCDAVVINCAKSLQLRKVAKSLESIFFQKRQFSDKLSQDSFAAMASPPHSRRLQYCELLTLCDCFYFRWKLKLLWLSLCVCVQISKLLLQTAEQGRMAQHGSCVGLDPGMTANVCRKNVKCRSLMVTICTVTYRNIVVASCIMMHHDAS